MGQVVNIAFGSFAVPHKNNMRTAAIRSQADVQNLEESGLTSLR
jgi:hypothetical protein